MTQGAIKSKHKALAASTKRPSVLGPKKGARTIAPRKQTLVKNAKMVKKHSAGLTAMTERALGAKAGHLELLGGGKRDSKKGIGKGKGKGVEVKKGGSKKFG